MLSLAQSDPESRARSIAEAEGNVRNAEEMRAEKKEAADRMRSELDRLRKERAAANRTLNGSRKVQQLEQRLHILREQEEEASLEGPQQDEGLIEIQELEREATESENAAKEHEDR